MYAQTAPHPASGMRVSTAARFRALAMLRDACPEVPLHDITVAVDTAAAALVDYGDGAARAALLASAAGGPLTAHYAVNLLREGMTHREAV